MVRLVPMTENEFEAYLDQTVPKYAAENVRAGYWSEEGALERSRKIYLNLLPRGVETENNYLFHIQTEESGEKVGVVWIKHEVPRPHGFIFDIRLDETQRGIKAMESRPCWHWKNLQKNWDWKRSACTSSRTTKLR